MPHQERARAPGDGTTGPTAKKSRPGLAVITERDAQALAEPATLYCTVGGRVVAHSIRGPYAGCRPVDD
jgi:hypothetical protein